MDASAQDAAPDAHVDVPDAHVDLPDAHVDADDMCAGSCTPVCGDGRRDDAEACDDGMMNGVPGSCCDVACQLAPRGTLCRVGSANGCDPDEFCDGSSSMCAADQFAPDGTACVGNGVGECSDADSCTAGLCLDHDRTAGTICGDARVEPTCNPDACDGSGVCVDATPLDDGAACADSGDTCCASQCVLGAPSSGECDPCALPASPRPIQVAIVDDSAFVGPTLEYWIAACANVGLVSTTIPLSDLAVAGSLTGYDVVVQTVPMLDATQRANVQAFVEGGGSVYLQGEWDYHYSVSQSFAELVTTLGGEFAWTSIVSGDLSPTEIRGCYATYPHAVPTLSFFWWGSGGSGTPDPMMVWGGNNIGFSFCPPTVGQGRIVHVTDRDWVSQAEVRSEVPLLLENIVARLAAPCR